MEKIKFVSESVSRTLRTVYVVDKADVEISLQAASLILHAASISKEAGIKTIRGSEFSLLAHIALGIEGAKTLSKEIFTLILTGRELGFLKEWIQRGISYAEKQEEIDKEFLIEMKLFLLDIRELLMPEPNE